MDKYNNFAKRVDRSVMMRAILDCMKQMELEVIVEQPPKNKETETSVSSQKS